MKTGVIIKIYFEGLFSQGINMYKHKVQKLLFPILREQHRFAKIQGKCIVYIFCYEKHLTIALLLT